MDESLYLEHKRNIINQQSLVDKLTNGLNYFEDIKFPSFHSRKVSRNKTVKTETKSKNHSQMYQTLQQSKFRYQKLKTQMKTIRQFKYNQFIKKSIKYQDLLDINEIKKKQLRTLNKKVGEVIRKNHDLLLTKNYQYHALFRTIKVQGWKPQSRQGHTCVLYKDSIIMIGGHCSNPFSKINVFSLSDNIWMKPIQSSIARSYHTSILYKNKYIITFGGMGSYNSSRKCRQCYNSIYLLDLGNYKGKMLKMGNQELIEPRRSHSATVFGKHMIVFGGISSKKQYLSDLVELDLKELKWTVKEYKIDGGIAKHQIVTVFKNRKSYPLYSPEYTQNQGLYVFGGKNKNGTQNILMQICFNKFIPVIKKISSNGEPSSLTDPLVTIRDENNILILSGELNNRAIHLYRIKQQTFIQVICDCKSIMGIGSTMIDYQNTYYLFLGLGESGYIGNINSFTITQKISQYQINKKKKNNVNIEWRNTQQLTRSLVTDSESSVH